MTYCVAVNLDAGMIFASDSRTNAGVDHIAKFSKMRVYSQRGERVIVILSSGNLSTTQNTINLLEERIKEGDTARHLYNAGSMFEVARLVGEALREVQRRDGQYLTQRNIDASANFIVGGQINGEPPRLFMIYCEGNFIESGRDTCYFQIGEIKYGKPIIDRVVHSGTTLVDATKCVLISFDSTMRSNISVGPPIDVLVYRADSFDVDARLRLDEDDPYYQMIHNEWGAGLRRVFTALPNPEWITGTKMP